MLDEGILAEVKKGLQRIFAMRISRCTYREVQNALLATAKGNKEVAEGLLQSLASGEIVGGIAEGNTLYQLRDLIDTYSVPIRVSKDVLERGEFVNLLTSETLDKADNILFLNRVRRIDGEEFHFITDAASQVHLLQHFVGRMQELEKTDRGRKAIADQAEQLKSVKAAVDELVNLIAAN